MRIAVSGSHATGKSSLIEELTRLLIDVDVVEESYHLLMAEGVEFTDPPDLDDYLTMMRRTGRDYALPRGGMVLFDRTPADYLAYAMTIDGGLPGGDTVALVHDALATLDLVVFIPIEAPDRIVEVGGHRRLRRSVDRLLRATWLDDSWGWHVPVLEVSGTPERRADQVAQWIRMAASASPANRHVGHDL